jgi:hypothetical protein
MKELGKISRGNSTTSKWKIQVNDSSPQMPILIFSALTFLHFPFPCLHRILRYLRVVNSTESLLHFVSTFRRQLCSTARLLNFHPSHPPGSGRRVDMHFEDSPTRFLSCGPEPRARIGWAVYVHTYTPLHPSLGAFCLPSSRAPGSYVRTMRCGLDGSQLVRSMDYHVHHRISVTFPSMHFRSKTRNINMRSQNNICFRLCLSYIVLPNSLATSRST